jgi:hypothetical protein
MRTLLALVTIALLAACSSTPKPDTSAPQAVAPGATSYASMDCAALEAERTRVVTEFNAMTSTDDAVIAAKNAEIETIVSTQSAKGCAPV